MQQQLTLSQELWVGQDLKVHRAVAVGAQDL